MKKIKLNENKVSFYILLVVITFALFFSMFLGTSNKIGQAIYQSDSDANWFGIYETHSISQV